MKARQRNLDSTWIVAFILVTGLAALFYWLAWFANPDSEPEPTIEIRTIELSPSITLSPTITFTFTPTATNTVTPTRLPSETATEIPSETPSPTFTLTSTATPTETPYPEPEVNPIILADTYAGEPIAISGEAQANDIIILLNNAESFTQTQADASGEWNINLDEGLAAGSHLLEIYAIGSGGGESPIVPLGFIVNEAPTETPTYTFTPSNTPSSTNTPTYTPSSTYTPSNTATFTPSATRTPRPTRTPTEISQVTSPSPEALILPSETPIPSLTSIPSQTPSFTSIPSQTPSFTSIPSQTPTPNENLLPASATFTTSPTTTFTPSITSTETAQPPTPSPEILNSPTEIALSPLSAPRFDTPKNPYSPFAPILVSGRAEPNTTITLRLDDDVLDEIPVDSKGLWQYMWESETRSGVVTALASDESGRVSPLARANFAVELSAPRITSPRRTITPMTSLSITGTAPAFAPLVLRAGDQDLGKTSADENGAWTIPLNLAELGVFDLQALILDETGEIAESSNLVRITVAESIAPATGGLFSDDQNQSNRIYTVLLALLLVVGGMWLILAVRLVYRRVR